MEEFVKVACPGCAKMLKMKVARLGQRVRCPACAMVFTAESPGESDPVPAETERGLRPAPIPRAGTLQRERQHPRENGFATSYDRRVAAALCRIVGLVFIVCGVLAIMGAGMEASQFPGGRMPAAQARQTMAFFQAAINVVMGILYLAWAGLIRDGAVVVAWIAAIIAGLLALVYTGAAGVGVLMILDGNVAGWLLLLLMGGLVLLLVKLIYHLLHAVVVSDRQPWKESAEERGFSESVQDVVAWIGVRPLLIGTGAALLAVNAVLATAAGMQLRSSLESAPKPSAERPPMATVTEPFDATDIYDARYGMNASERGALERKWASRWSPTQAMADRLDAILREDGKQLGNRPPVGPPEGGDQSRPPDVRWGSFDGTLEGDAWASFQEYGRQGWQQPVWRWQCFALQREMDLLKHRVPGATGLQKRAVYEALLKTPVVKNRNNHLQLPGVTRGAQGSIVLQVNGQTLRVTADGKIFDDTPAAVQAFENSQQQQAEAGRSEWLWRWSPLGIAVDAAVAAMLGAAMLVIGCRMKGAAALPRWLKKRALTSVVFSVLAWGWFAAACYELGRAWAPRLGLAAIPVVGILVAAKLLQVFVPRVPGAPVVAERGGQISLPRASTGRA
jgi:hypothetical protein